MITDLQEEEWDLDGFRFGITPTVWLLESGLDWGSPTTRTQDADNAVGDGMLFGRDYLSGPEMSLSLAVRDEGGHVAQRVAELAALWRNPAVRLSPGALSVLSTREGGTIYQMFGRPRKFGIVPARKKNDYQQKLECTFQLQMPERYIMPDTGQPIASFELRAGPGDGGLILPAILPWELAPNSQGDSRTITVGGSSPAPFRLIVKGPVTGTLRNIRVTGLGWVFESSATLAYDQQLVVDTRTMTATVGGNSIAGTLTPQTRLSARLQPGNQQITFDGLDPSNTATATITWLDTISL